MILQNVIIVFSLLVVSAAFAAAMTPVLTNFLFRHRFGKQIRDANETPIYSAMHAQKAGTPTMAGVLVWGSALLMTVVAWSIARVVPLGFFHDANFWSRSETYLPIGMMVLAASVGLVDDLYNIRRRGAHGGGLRVRERLLLFAIVATIGAWWFITKLDWTTLHLPLFGNIDIGWWYAPLFILVIVGTGFSVDITDGLDGLAGGLLLICFMTFGVIAFLQGRVELASFIAVIVGALAAFLWFNVPPARFFMGDTGAMGLGVTLGVIAMLTNLAALLIVIGFPFVIEAISVILQVVSKRIRHKKIFLSAPLHHHLEAKGWSEPKIVMRFWIIGAISGVAGLTIFLIDRL
jgi:phospho-N-acetylmuramoyl-pentapeptide-transferase